MLVLPYKKEGLTKLASPSKQRWLLTEPTFLSVTDTPHFEVGASLGLQHILFPYYLNRLIKTDFCPLKKLCQQINLFNFLFQQFLETYTAFRSSLFLLLSLVVSLSPILLGIKIRILCKPYRLNYRCHTLYIITLMGIYPDYSSTSTFSMSDLLTITFIAN